MSKKQNNLIDLFTSDEPLEKIPLSEYPRPQFKRDSYINLNGEWEFEAKSNSEIPLTFSQKIIVPFCVESSLSNIHKRYPKGTYYFYKKKFHVDKSFIKDIVLLHLDGVDQECFIFLNNQLVDTNKGGYLPSSFDVKLLIHEENELIIVCKDDLDTTQLYGKQREDRGGMWYTPVSGIWKTVWLESYNNKYFKDLKITTTLNTVNISINTNIKRKKIIIHTETKDIVKEFSSNNLTLVIDKPVHWTLEHPFLYYFDLISDEDKIESYFALRTFTIQQYNNHLHFFLNNQPIFLHGLLDQGYYPDGIYTPRSYKEYEKDIITMKELGFNTLRKHIKIEPLYFYYLCDKLGMLLIQDMVNNGDYHYIKETVIPTIGYKKFKDTSKRLKSPQAHDIFIKSTKNTIVLLRNHPSIIMWTIYNEGWGQYLSKDLYQLVKLFDPTRIIDTTSGWFDQGYSDVNSVHVYFRKIKIKPNDKLTYVSEFGGYNYRIKEHSFNQDNDYGYKGYKNIASYQKGLLDLYTKQVIPQIKNGLAGTIYTQLSDVEDETNGLLTYDRKVLKVDKNTMLELAKKLKV